MSIIRRLFGQWAGRRHPDPPKVQLSIDPVTRAAAERVARVGHCACLATRGKSGRPSVPNLHTEPQDRAAPGWIKIVELVRGEAKAQSTILEPSAKMSSEEWTKVITLPAEVRELRDLREMRLYGSHLRRLPPALGRLGSLEDLDLYTSYSLHWLPYEVTRCTRLKRTRMSTRALYGNRNTRLPFPRLRHPIETLMPETCSVCDKPFGSHGPQLLWTTQRVGTDDAPLLIHSCSETCTARVPDAPQGYQPRPHKGGGGVGMPEAKRTGSRAW